jgi:hypothetical protein
MNTDNYYLSQALLSLRPNSEFAFTEADYSTIEWHVIIGEAPTNAEVEAAIKQVKIDEANAEKSRLDAKDALLAKLGITSDELSILLG